jgi:hypothetical protein
MAVELTGPGNCAECGTPTPIEACLAGDAGQLVVSIKGHAIEVPGLYVCTGCAGAIMVGEREPTVTWEAARDFLNDIYGPILCGHLLMPVPDGIVTPEMVIERLADVMEVQQILEMAIHFRDNGGLDFLPECKGDCGGHEIHPRDMAEHN